MQLSDELFLSRRGILRGGAIAALAGMFPVHGAFAQQRQAWPKVEALLANYVSDRKVANMVAGLGIGAEAPQFLAQGSDSLKGDRTADSRSLYRIYSMTKPITGMAAMILVDQGKLQLDQPISDFLPKFARMQVQKVYDGPVSEDNLEPAVRPITIRHLLTHTAGLGYSIVQQGPIAEAYKEAGLTPFQVTRNAAMPAFAGTPAPSLEVFADRLADMPLVYQPGTHWSYSVGLDLLGRIIEIVSGQTFDGFLQDHILGPCGMVDTSFTVPRAKADRLTTNYIVAGSMLLPIDSAENSIFFDPPAFPFGGAGLVSTPADYDRFLKMLVGYGNLDGKRVMSEAAIRLGTSDLFPKTMDGADEFSKSAGFGAGGRVGRGAEAGSYGWSGAAGTVAFADLKHGLRAGLFTQYMPSQAYPLTSAFPDAVKSDLGGAALSRDTGMSE
ncbi:serine hydrolase domain-containing protein [Altericroceibacterium endophyticum]|uniref:Serine hydrolase n=1 Tax=Altericroceibacterium endophyticum TaxID=1808508 RepID=A0A6I4TAT8_9SPHN|nr:serine hydrolase domain-containing protein [Altericroceibacterium endophyticum]MXO66875.1 serine hydrolase [Altericroceibacterium endophyticum]